MQALELRRKQASEAEKQISAHRQELAEVGQRLEEAREQELAARERLTALSHDATAMTKKLAEGESELQQSRETHARLQQEAVAHQQRVSQLGEREKELAGKVQELVRTEKAAAQASNDARNRADKLQSDLADLSEILARRNTELADVQDSIQSARSTLAALHERIAEARRTLLKGGIQSEGQGERENLESDGSRNQEKAASPDGESAQGEATGTTRQ